MSYEPLPELPLFSLLEPPTPNEPNYVRGLCRYVLQIFIAVAVYNVARFRALPRCRAALAGHRALSIRIPALPLRARLAPPSLTALN